MRQIFSCLLFIIAISCSAQSVVSDEIFGNGIELYRKGKYADAIKAFKESQKRDDLEMDSIEARKIYTKRWIAHCYYKMHKIEEAEATGECDYIWDPVDRRLTVASDSLSTLAAIIYRNGNIPYAITKLQESMQEERKTLGDNHHFVANSEGLIAELYSYQGDVVQSREHLRKAEIIYLAKGMQESCSYANMLLTEARLSMIENNLSAAAESAKKSIEIFSKWKNAPAYSKALALSFLLFESSNPTVRSECKGYSDQIYELLISFDDNDILAGSEIIPLCLQSKQYYQEYGDAMLLVDKSLDVLKSSGMLNGNNPFYLQLLSIKATILQAEFRSQEAVDTLQLLIDTCEHTMFFDRNLLDEYYLSLANCYSAGGEIRKALEAAQEAYSRASRRVDDRRLIKAGADQLIGYVYAQIERRDEAIKFTEEALKIVEEVCGKNSPDYCKGLIALAEIESIKDPSKAKSDLMECRSILKNLNVVEAGVLMKVDYSLYTLLQNQNDNEELSSIIAEIKSVSEDESLPEEIRNVSKSLVYIIDAKDKPAKERIELYETGLNYLSNYQSSDLSNVKRELARAYVENLDYEKALKLANEMIASTKDKPSLRDAHIQNLILLSNIMANRYDWESAKKYMNESLELAQELYGSDSRHYVEIVLMEAYQLNNQGMSAEALKLCKSVTKQVSQLYGENEIQKGFYYQYLSDITGSLGSLPESIEFGEKALKNFTACNNKQYKLYALRNLGQQYNQMNNYTQALSMLNEALKLSDELSNNNRFTGDAVQIFNSLGDVYNSMGNYKDALTNFNLSYEIAKEIFSEDDPVLIAIIGKRAQVKLATGEMEEAEELIKQVIEKNIEWFGEDNILTQNSKVFKAQIEFQRGNVDLAQAELEKIYAEQLGEKLYIPATMVLLMNIYKSKGEYAKGIEVGNKLLKESKNIKNYELTIANLNGQLAELYFALGNTDKSVECMSKTESIYKGTIIDNFLLMTKRERATLWSSALNFYQVILPNACVMAGDHNKFTKLLYDATLFSKGLLLQADNNIVDVIKGTNDSKLADEYAELQSISSEYKRLTTICSKQTEEDLKFELVSVADSLYDDMEKRERALMGKLSSVAGNYTSKLSTTWSDVRKSLRTGQIAVEFSMASPMNDSLQYFALVLTPESKVPEYIALTHQSELSDYLPYQFADKEDYQSLAELIWSPILKAYPNAKDIFFSPVGELYNIPIESLPLPTDTTRLISELYNIYRLTSTRELAERHKSAEVKGMAVYGGLKYTTTAEELTKDAAKYDPGLTRESSFVSFIDSELENERGRKLQLKSLPGTEVEADSIISLITGRFSDKISVMPYLEDSGTEASFKALSGKDVRVVHIGTHGFYYPQSMVVESSNLRDLFDLNDDINIKSNETTEDQALSRCGLYMTGAQNRLNGEMISGVDDGVLTAKEISVMNLENVDLAVLSACGTGTGDITGDGVFGLQRGFKKAGTKAILMSLWSVNDESTSVLMTEFYRQWLSTGDMRKSLENAKTLVRSHKKWESPYYWAPFVLLDAVDMN